MSPSSGRKKEKKKKNSAKANAVREGYRTDVRSEQTRPSVFGGQMGGGRAVNTHSLISFVLAQE